MKPRQYGINLEWELCNATMLEARAPEMYGMLHEYITVKKVFPGKSPDGTYNPSTWTEDITAVRGAKGAAAKGVAEWGVAERVAGGGERVGTEGAEGAERTEGDYHRARVSRQRDALAWNAKTRKLRERHMIH